MRQVSFGHATLVCDLVVLSSSLGFIRGVKNDVDHFHQLLRHERFLYKCPSVVEHQHVSTGVTEFDPREILDWI